MDPELPIEQDERLLVDIRQDLLQREGNGDNAEEPAEVDDGEGRGQQQQDDDLNQPFTLDQILVVYHHEHIEKMETFDADSNTEFEVGDLITLALHPELREAFETAFAESNVDHFCFYFFEVQTLLDIQDSALYRNAFLDGFREVLQCLGSIRLLSIEFFGLTPLAFPWLSRVIAHCSKVKEISLLLQGGEIPLDWDLDLAEHHQLKEVILSGMPINSLRFMSGVLTRIPHLSEVKIGGVNGPERSPMIIESSADVEVLQSIISLPGLSKLSLENITLANMSATSSFCESIASSSLMRCIFSEVVFPQASSAVVVDAIVRAPLKSLAYDVSDSAVNLYGPICRGIQQSSTLEALTLGNRSTGTHLDCDELPGWLGDSLWNRLDFLSLALRNWSASFERYIAGFIQKHHLYVIKFHLSEDFDGPSRAPKTLIAAVDNGARNLQAVSVSRTKKIEGGLYLTEGISKSWSAELRPILDLNTERFEHEARFASIEEAAVASNDVLRHILFVKFLEAVEATYLYGFLRRDEWNLLGMIKELGCERKDGAAELPESESESTPPAKRRRME